MFFFPLVRSLVLDPETYVWSFTINMNQKSFSWQTSWGKAALRTLDWVQYTNTTDTEGSFNHSLTHIYTASHIYTTYSYYIAFFGNLFILSLLLRSSSGTFQALLMGMGSLKDTVSTLIQYSVLFLPVLGPHNYNSLVQGFDTFFGLYLSLIL